RASGRTKDFAEPFGASQPCGNRKPRPRRGRKYYGLLTWALAFDNDTINDFVRELVLVFRC
ncbi:MAG: hypothetical protein ACJ8LN_06545, partial [Sulfurifustis sp.]